MDNSKGNPADPTNGVVVGGVDWSPASRNVAQWAAAEAACRKATLLLVHAYMLPGAGEPESHQSDGATTASHIRGEHLLADIAVQVGGSHPGVPVTTRLVHGDAVTALREASAGARLTVVGSPGAGRVSDVVLGSVAMTIASNNPAPVAVVPARRPGEGRGAVVVGVDDSPTSDPALAFAFDQAAVWGASLIAVHSWNDVRVDAAVPVHDMIIDKEAIDSDVQAELAGPSAGVAGPIPRWGGAADSRPRAARAQPASLRARRATDSRGQSRPRPLHRSASRLDRSYSGRPLQLPGGDRSSPGRQRCAASSEGLIDEAEVEAGDRVNRLPGQGFRRQDRHARSRLVHPADLR